MTNHEEAGDVPDGASVLPEIPPELNVHPLLLAVLHATVFLAGSDEKVVDSAAAQEALDRLAGYLQRLNGPDLERVTTDLACLADFANEEKWPRHEVQFFKSFLKDFGVD